MRCEMRIVTEKTNVSKATASGEGTARLFFTYSIQTQAQPYHSITVRVMSFMSFSAAGVLANLTSNHGRI